MAKMNTRRKLAIATWRSPREGNIYGKIELDATNAQAYINYHRKVSGKRVTITHLIGKAIAKALKQAPTLNGRIVFGRFIPHKTVDVTFLVSLEGGSDLAKAKIIDADKKSTVQISEELQEKSIKLHRGQDQEFEKAKGVLRILPTWILRPIIWVTGFLSGGLGLKVKSLGLEPFPFGSCIITSLGMFGIDEGFAPPTPFARVPLYVLVGSIRDIPAVVNGQIVVRPYITLSATIDHRFIDGHQLTVLSSIIKNSIDNPWLLDGLEGPPADFSFS
ncbi:MAG: 2-oxo acid dehydrogenase subunit E2 [Desulfobacterales bacterium]|nr:2-oxo acid dehydrogenase subunit E2 [Desulfobacterales bacterium]